MPDFESDVSASFGITIGKVDQVSNDVRNLNQRIASMMVQPAWSRDVAQATVNANGIAVLVLGGPTQGFVREYRGVTVAGVTPATAVAGIGYLYVMQGGLASANSSILVSGLAVLGSADWVDQASTLPSNAFYGAGQLVVKNQEKLALIVTGGTSGQQLVANARFVEYQEGSNKQTFEL